MQKLPYVLIICTFSLLVVHFVSDTHSCTLETTILEKSYDTFELTYIDSQLTTIYSDRLDRYILTSDYSEVETFIFWCDTFAGENVLSYYKDLQIFYDEIIEEKINN